ncbi:ABC transporter permease [Arthrobacter sp. Sa2BUA2]|uniref:ABC transporter permease n=1 Tax=Arthrobacter pullicola TaxID=2762224 RepID=A0ABR8YE19_9MICC|nr:ABC transporter permease [Arthrobacter pullicola]MBD8042455.1 ABC transporter permease [Arthrobacter pullicola]
MSTSTAPAPTRRAARPDGSGVNFARILRSEWIKVTTVPSTVILLATTLVVMVGIAALVAWSWATTAQMLADDPTMGPAMGVGAGMDLQAMVYDTPASGVLFGQLLIAALAVVLIASEYSTGMIRSTMVAVPSRTPALFAKAIITAVVAFVIGVAGAFASFLISQPLLATENLDFTLDVPWVLPSIINTGTFLAAIAVMGVAIGSLLRSTAGGVVTIIGALFVLPVIVQLISGLADWIPDAARFLPSSAGAQLVATNISDGALNQLEGGLVLGGWAVALLIAALVVNKIRDV